MMHRVQEQGGQATFMRVLTKEAGPGHSRISISTSRYSRTQSKCSVVPYMIS